MACIRADCVNVQAFCRICLTQFFNPFNNILITEPCSCSCLLDFGHRMLAHEYDIRNAEQLLAMDILVLVTMKNAAKCDT